MPRRQLDPKFSVSIVFVIAQFMSIMDGTIVNVALPSLERQLAIPNAAVDAIVVAYLVSLAMVIPASGWLGDRFGTKRVFLFALALFTAASVLCGLAGNLTQLILFRLLQGAAGGALTPVGSAMLYRTFSPRERVQVSRILMIPTVIAPALGPVLGGILVDQWSWRWVFFVNVPFGIAACLFGFVFLQEHREPTAGGLDLAGFLLAGLGLALTMIALSEGPAFGWTSIGILSSAIVGLLLLGTFVFVELRVQEPLLDLRLYRNHLFRTTNLISLFSGAAFTGVLFVGPLFLQEGRGLSALTSGLTTFPDALGVVLATQVVALLYPRVGPRRLIAVGLTAMAIMMALLSLVGSDTNLWCMRTLLFLTGAGMACVFLPVQVAGFATISSASTGRATTLSGVQGRVGGALGVAVLSEVLNVVGLTHLNADGALQSDLTAYHVAFLTAAVLALLAAGIALAISDRDAAITMLSKPSREKGVLANGTEQGGAPLPSQ